MILDKFGVMYAASLKFTFIYNHIYRQKTGIFFIFPMISKRHGLNKL